MDGFRRPPTRRGMGLMLGPEAKLKPVKVSEKVIQQRLLRYYTDNVELKFHLFFLIDFYKLKVLKDVMLLSAYSPTAEKKTHLQGMTSTASVSVLASAF